ncbi:MAG TPA: radical SAM protein [Spirochaetota bacterium]|nr:radical SAM protein [Spirochaetota bacterium]HPC39342.1 radical SAM protein [Spirochaetota bacterium]HPL15149.1 radical SAM protein [Spirochaetota bacterium]HQF08720.1 radical SAM protein [Spirochaetota bacterium]HQH97579.1 radical SAM protein [Spirochaetota bacterium]
MDLVRIITDTPGLRDRLASIRQDPLQEMPVIFAKIKLLWQCNLSCVFCERPAPCEPMSHEAFSRILGDLIGHGVRKIHFSGGEIFLHPDILAIIDTACSSGVQVNFTSNGTLITKEIAKAVTGIGVHSVSLSLDSSKPALHDRLRGRKGAYKLTVRALEHLARYRKKNPRLRVNTVVTRENCDDLDDMHALLAAMNRDIIWKLIPVDSQDRKMRLTEDQVTELADRSRGWDLLENRHIFSRYDSDKNISRGNYAGNYYRHYPCFMPWMHLFIDPGGFAYPCCMTRGKIPSVGNLINEPLSDLLKGSRMRDIRMSMSGANTFEVCGRCDDFILENKSIYDLIKSV